MSTLGAADTPHTPAAGQQDRPGAIPVQIFNGIKIGVYPNNAASKGPENSQGLLKQTRVYPDNVLPEGNLIAYRSHHSFYREHVSVQTAVSYKRHKAAEGRQTLLTISNKGA